MGETLKSNTSVASNPTTSGAPAADAANKDVPFQFKAGILSLSIQDLLDLLQQVLQMEQKNRQEQAEFTKDQAKAARAASDATKAGGNAALNYAIGAGAAALAGAAVGAGLTFGGAAHVAGLNTNEEDGTISENKDLLDQLGESDLNETEISTAPDAEGAEGTGEKLTARDMEDALDGLKEMISGGASKEQISSQMDTVKKINAQFEQAKALPPETDEDGNEIAGTGREANLDDAFGDDSQETRTPEERKKAVSEKMDKVKEVLEDRVKEAKEAKSDKVSKAQGKQQHFQQIHNTFVAPTVQAIQGAVSGAGTAAKATFDAASSNQSSTSEIQKGVASSFDSDTQKMDKLLSDLYGVIGNISRSLGTIGSKLS